MAAVFLFSLRASHKSEMDVPSAAAGAPASIPGPARAGPGAAPPDFKPLRGVHLTAWVAGAPRPRRQFLARMRGTWINAIVVPVKEIDGRVYIPGVAKAEEYGTALPAIPDPAAALRDMKAEGLYTIARIAVFKDDRLARRMPEWAVRRPDGSLWVNDRGVAWVDPYQREVWDYVLDVAGRAAALGFDEVQFDYIRFPSDGDTSLCRYARPDHSRATAVRSLKDFLAHAVARLKPSGVKVSVAVFGMATTSRTDMGIGQELAALTAEMDAVSPMMYPSHYARGEYGLRDPNREPYKVVFRGLRDAKARMGGRTYKLRPYLQDFSLGRRYGPAEVRAQILAAQAQGVESWILWNPGNRYTWEAVRRRPDSPLRFGASRDAP